MTVLLPVASGKGGVGKSIFVANLGLNLAARGKTVILIDLDLGGSNLHTFLGLKNRYPGLGNFIYKKESNLEALLVKTEIDRLFFIPGDCLLPGTANLDFFMKQKIIRGIKSLIADYVLMDLGSGSSFNTIDFFLTSSTGIILTTPEVTAILNAYGFLKTALYRLLILSFPRQSEERRLIRDFVSNRIEGTERSFQMLFSELSKINPESADMAARQIKSFYPRVVINMGRNESDLAVGARLRTIARKNLGVELEYIGFLYQDDQVGRSMLERKPTFLSNPNSPFSKAIDLVSRKLLSLPDTPQPRLYEDNEDLLSLAEAGQGL